MCSKVTNSREGNGAAVKSFSKLISPLNKSFNITVTSPASKRKHGWNLAEFSRDYRGLFFAA